MASTGTFSVAGSYHQRTLLMVSQELSATGVSGRPLEVIIKDTNGSPDKTVTFCKELIDDPSVLAILGPSTTGELLQVKPLCEEAHIPLICYASGDVILEPPTMCTRRLCCSRR